MITNLPAPVRHLIVLLAATSLGWGSTDLVPILSGQPGYGAAVGSLLGFAIAWLTPLVQEFGVGSGSGAHADGGRNWGAATPGGGAGGVG